MLTQHVHFIYDVLNALIGEEVDTTGSGSYDQIERFVVSGGQPALEFDGGGDLIERNLIAPNPARNDAIMAQEAVTSTSSGGAVLWMVDDKLGTPRDDLDNSGTLVNHEVFRAFGEIVYQSNPSIHNWAGFAGGHLDAATGLMQDGRRFYDPAMGYWLSQDPMGFSARDTNLSRYVGNNVTDDLDPTGLLDPSMGYSTQDGVMTTWITLADASGSVSTSAVMQSQMGDTVPDLALAWMPATTVPPGTTSAAGIFGGVIAGLPIGAVMGTIGSGIAVTTICVISVTPVGAAAWTVILIGTAMGAATGAVVGGMAGSSAPTIGSGIVDSASNPGTYIAPLIVGAMTGLTLYGVAPGTPPTGYVNVPDWWPWQTPLWPWEEELL